jgi:hypothetical protein
MPVKSPRPMPNSSDPRNNHALSNAGRFDVWAHGALFCEVANPLIVRPDAPVYRNLPPVLCETQRVLRRRWARVLQSRVMLQSDQDLLNDLVPEQASHKQRRSNFCNGTRAHGHTSTIG